MKKIIINISVCILLTINGCKENSAQVKEDNTPRLVLTADKTSGQAPLKVTFTGQFLGNIDTIRMSVPDYFLFPGAGRTIIRYKLVDTTQPARPTYTEEFSYSAIGNYKAVMLLQSKIKDYYSDTLNITVY